MGSGVITGAGVESGGENVGSSVGSSTGGGVAGIGTKGPPVSCRTLVSSMVGSAVVSLDESGVGGGVFLYVGGNDTAVVGEGVCS